MYYKVMHAGGIMQKDNEQIFTTRMPADLKEAFAKATKAQDLTPSQVVRKLVKEWLAKQAQVQ
jgi:antitoxin component of RelBE/YafQ-DinJ toxin-antitoxin module